MTTYTYPLGPGKWVYTDGQIPGFIVSAHIQQFAEGWIITDLAVAAAPPDWKKRIPSKKDRPFVSSVLPKPDGITTPYGGIVSGTLTSLRVEDLRRWVADEVGMRPKLTSAQAAWDADLVAAFRSGKRVKRTPQFYARIAAIYVEESQRTDKVYKAMAERIPLAESTIRDIVKKARKLDLLTRPPGQGRRGGQLTDEARFLLEQESGD